MSEKSKMQNIVYCILLCLKSGENIFRNLLDSTKHTNGMIHKKHSTHFSWEKYVVESRGKAYKICHLCLLNFELYECIPI